MHHGLQITNQLFKSNLTFCVVCIFTVQSRAFTIDSSTPTLRRNLNEHLIVQYIFPIELTDYFLILLYSVHS
jgi:hypothetical protein